MQSKQEWLQENGLYKCPYCGKEYNKKGIATHIWRNHTEEGKKHDPNKCYKNGTKHSWCKGLTKETDERIRKTRETFNKRIKNGEIKYAFEGRKHTQETKEKIRQARFNYLSKKLGKTGWEKSQKKEMTYLEEKFYNEVILTYNLLDKYDISYNFPIYPYFLDFALININLSVELDGACHFKNGEQRYEHDIQRDNYLLEKGWKTFRIAYDDDWNDKVNELLNILNNIENYKQKIGDKKIYKYGEFKKQQNIIKKQQKIKEKQEKINEKINLILNSDINFEKFGWVGKVAEILNISPQKVNQWMKRNMLEFYNTKCFKRK